MGVLSQSGLKEVLLKGRGIHWKTRNPFVHHWGAPACGSALLLYPLEEAESCRCSCFVSVEFSWVLFVLIFRRFLSMSICCLLFPGWPMFVHTTVPSWVAVFWLQGLHTRHPLSSRIASSSSLPSCLSKVEGSVPSCAVLWDISCSWWALCLVYQLP